MLVDFIFDWAHGLVSLPKMPSMCAWIMRTDQVMFLCKSVHAENNLQIWACLNQCTNLCMLKSIYKSVHTEINLQIWACLNQFTNLCMLSTQTCIDFTDFVAYHTALSPCKRLRTNHWVEKRCHLYCSYDHVSLDFLQKNQKKTCNYWHSYPRTIQ